MKLKTVPFTGDGEVNALAKLLTEIKVETQLVINYCLFFWFFQRIRTDADYYLQVWSFEL